MRDKKINHAFTIGYECFVSHYALVDRINVFPVADADTGTNLRISLSPLRDVDNIHDNGEMSDILNRSAIGNSGNIAAAFFREFIRVENIEDLGKYAELGRQNSWQAVAEPCSGSILSVFDSLVQSLESSGNRNFLEIERQLGESVLDTTRKNPVLERAGVVDAGALAMFIFFTGFFRQINGEDDFFIPVSDLLQID